MFQCGCEGGGLAEGRELMGRRGRMSPSAGPRLCKLASWRPGCRRRARRAAGGTLRAESRPPGFDPWRLPPMRACVLCVPITHLCGWWGVGGLVVPFTVLPRSRHQPLRAFGAYGRGHLTPRDGIRCAVQAPVPGNSTCATGARSCCNVLCLSIPHCWCVTRMCATCWHRRTRF